VNNGGIPLVRATDISDGRLSFDKARNISIEQHKSLTKYRKSKRGDVLVSKSGSLGVCAIVDVDHEFSIYESIIVLQSKPMLCPEFLLWLMRDDRTQLRMIGEKVGSSVAHLNIEMFRKLAIQIPTLTEQTAIADVLSDAVALIQSLENLIAKKLYIKQGAMHELLKPKDGWVAKKLGDVITGFQNGYGFSAKGYVNDGIPIVTMAQIGLDGKFKFDETKIRRWKKEDLNSLKSFHLNNGDVIIAMTDVTPEKNLIGRMTIVETDRILLLNQRVGHLRIDKSKVNPNILTALSNMKNWRNYSIASASLGVQANIGTRDILNGILELPSIEEQIRIATILSDMDAEIAALENKLAKYRRLKQGMMQNLLTGRIRLL